MCSTTTDDDGGTPITTIHPDIIQSHILNRLDGQTLASTTCASAQLFSLCSQDILWRQICNSTWPSTTHPTVRHAIAAFPSGHRSFYSDSFPSVRRRSLTAANPSRAPPSTTSELISAVNIYYDDILVLSKVIVTETISGWFLSSPFRLDLAAFPSPVDGGEGVRERLRVNWIVIDASKKRAVNIASARAVELRRRHWMTMEEEVELRYATVVGEVFQCAVVVSCGGKELEVSMQVEDIEGKILNGLDSLGILQTALEGQRWKTDVKTEEDIYGVFLEMKVKSREAKLKREKRLDMLCIAAGVTIFFAIFTFFLFR